MNGTKSKMVKVINHQKVEFKSKDLFEFFSLKQLFNISSPKNNSIQKSLTLFVYIAQCKWCWPCSVFPNENIANESSLLSRSESSTNIAHIEVRMMSLVCELSVHQRIRIKQRRTAIDSETPYRSHSFFLCYFEYTNRNKKYPSFITNSCRNVTTS